MKHSTFTGLVALALAFVMFLGAEWWYLRSQLSGGWFSATGDPSTVLPALGMVFLAVAVPLFLKGSGRLSVPLMRRRVIILIASIAFLVTLSMGWLLTEELVTPAAVGWNGYGFPLAWRVDIMRGCPPWCSLPSNTTTFNGPFFVIDWAFYLAIGFAAFLAYKPVGQRLIHVSSPLRRFLTRHGQLSIRTLVVALIAILSLAIVETTLFWTAAIPSGPCTSNLLCQPQAARLSMVQFWANSPTNSTVKIMNLGPTSVTISSYSVTDNANNQFVSSSWSGPTIGPGVAVAFDVTIDGLGFDFHWGGMYTLKIVDLRGDQYTFSTDQLGIDILYVSLNTTTSAILNITNTGPPSITFNAYKVKDPVGHWSNNTSWSGPTVTPGTGQPANIVIDGQTFTSPTGTTYTLYLFDTTGTEWTIYITP